MSALAAYVGGILSGAGVMAAFARHRYGPAIARLETALLAAERKLAAPPPEPLVRYIDRYIERPAESSPARAVAAPAAPAAPVPPATPTRPGGHAERLLVIRRTAEGYEVLHAGERGAEAGRQFAAATPSTGAIEMWDGADRRGVKG